MSIDSLEYRYGELLGGCAWLETAQQLAYQGLFQTLHSLQLLITVTTYLSGTRILAEQHGEFGIGAVVGGVGGGAILEAGSLSLFQQLCADLFRGMFGLAGMGNAFGTAAGDVAAVEAILNQNLRPMLADSTGRQLSDVVGDIELRGVTFSYPDSCPPRNAPDGACSTYPKSGPID